MKLTKIKVKLGNGEWPTNADSGVQYKESDTVEVSVSEVVLNFPDGTAWSVSAESFEMVDAVIQSPKTVLDIMAEKVALNPLKSSADILKEPKNPIGCGCSLRDILGQDVDSIKFK